MVCSGDMRDIMTNTKTGKADSGLLTRYNDLQSTFQHISGNTACRNLEQFVLDTLTYWHTTLIQTFST